MIYNMSKYGANIIANESNSKMSAEILEILTTEDSVDLDFTGIQVVTTYAAKSILKPIVDKYGFSALFQKLSFLNVPSDIKVVISTAIDGLKN